LYQIPEGARFSAHVQIDAGALYAPEVRRTRCGFNNPLPSSAEVKKGTSTLRLALTAYCGWISGFRRDVNHTGALLGGYGAHYGMNDWRGYEAHYGMNDWRGYGAHYGMNDWRGYEAHYGMNDWPLRMGQILYRNVG